jgi:hypothetical protein
MELSQVTFLAFAVFNSLRVVSYLPQIVRVAADTNGASAISYTTWGLWTAANLSTGLYAAVNLHDFYLSAVSAINTACCAFVIALTVIKRRSLRRRVHASRTLFAGTQVSR